MANPKKRSRAWVLLALLPVCGVAAFFSVRALSRTPAKIDAEKLVAQNKRLELLPLYGALMKNEQDVNVMQRMVHSNRQRG